MLIAFYRGGHAKDDWAARLGYALIELGQISELYGDLTHCEAILSGDWQAAQIASASVRDGNQVRIKTTGMNPAHWLVLDVPAADVVRVHAWFLRHLGVRYSMVGATASALWLARLLLKAVGKRPADLGQWCSRAVAEAIGLVGAEDMNVAELAATLMSLPGTRDVTDQFFQRQQGAPHA